MPFNSLIFLGFISIIFLINPRLRLPRQNIFLLAMSYIFYGFWDWRFNLLLLTSTVVDFLIAQKIYTAITQKQKKWLLGCSIAVNLGILCFFKYFNFFLDSMASVLASVGVESHLPVLRIILPVGISFYIFKTLGYAIDVYRKKIEPEKNIINYALFVSFFPQLVAGPIERASNLLPQISNPRKVTMENVWRGLNLILLGCFKKIVIADTLAPIVDKIFADPSGFSSGQLWTGIYAFTFQIYGDFSGYTDIARGVSRILGFEIMENFNTPYLSRNITEFWRRWHISLSTWFRDYVYISLGGNRQGKVKTYFNLTITFFLCGLWHGAGWNFIIWGFLHGFYLVSHRMISGEKRLNFSWPSTLTGWTIYTIKVFFIFHLVALAWVLFRAPNLGSAIIYLRGLFHFQEFSGISFQVVFAASLLIALDITQTLMGCSTWLTDLDKGRLVRYVIVQIMLISVIAAAIAHVNKITPFIYFQF